MIFSNLYNFSSELSHIIQQLYFFQRTNDIEGEHYKTLSSQPSQQKQGNLVMEVPIFVFRSLKRNAFLTTLKLLALRLCVWICGRGGIFLPPPLKISASVGQRELNF